MRNFLPVSLVGFLLALAPLAPTLAQACESDPYPPQFDVGVAGQRYYAINDCPRSGANPPHDYCVSYPVNGWWIYEESNGIDGLQRHDDNVDDTCGGTVAPDTLHW